MSDEVPPAGLPDHPPNYAARMPQFFKQQQEEMKMSEFKIEKNIPVPCNKSKRGGYKYPFNIMEVGDSFLVENRTMKKMSSIVHYAQKSTGFKFMSRSGDGGVRVWRIA